jgi:hypothetical protein
MGKMVQIRQISEKIKKIQFSQISTISGDALSNTRISFRQKQETKTISEMDDN